MSPVVHKQPHGYLTKPTKWERDYQSWQKQMEQGRLKEQELSCYQCHPCGSNVPWDCSTTVNWTHSVEFCCSTSGSICRYPMDCPFGPKGEPPSTPKSVQKHLSKQSTPPSPLPFGLDPEVMARLLGTVDLPNQLELEQVAQCFPSFKKQEGEAHFDQQTALYTCLEELTAVTMSPQKLATALSKDATFELIWDSGASHCITNCKDDFEGDFTKSGIMGKLLQGLGVGLKVQGTGTVSWTVLDRDGRPRTLRLKAYYVPDAPVRILSTSQLLQVGVCWRVTDIGSSISNSLRSGGRPNSITGQSLHQSHQQHSHLCWI